MSARLHDGLAAYHAAEDAVIPVPTAGDQRAAEMMNRVYRVYRGSDGEATRALYAELAALGPAGEVAVNLFRATKSSERAKQYRGRGYKGMAYDRKQWSMDNLCAVLGQHGAALGIVYGWGVDEQQPYHRHVLYVELPPQGWFRGGQVSFHTAARGAGPDHDRDWDGERNAAADRVIRWAAALLTSEGAA